MMLPESSACGKGDGTRYSCTGDETTPFLGGALFVNVKAPMSERARQWRSGTRRFRGFFPFAFMSV